MRQHAVTLLTKGGDERLDLVHAGVVLEGNEQGDALITLLRLLRRANEIMLLGISSGQRGDLGRDVGFDLRRGLAANLLGADGHRQSAGDVLFVRHAIMRGGKFVMLVVAYESRAFIKVAISGLNLLVGVSAVEIGIFPINVATNDHPTARLVVGVDGF